jgi:UDP-N-acetylglucosamine:LPS N-acetylglucosamine transferase
MTTKKALIISVKAGGGHIALANALQAHLELWGYETKHIQILGNSMENMYKFQDKLGIYEQMYGLSDKPFASSLMLKLYQNQVEKEIETQLPNYATEFDFVFSTYFLVHPKGGKTRIMYIPDPLYHHGWGVGFPMDYYFFAWDEGAKAMVLKAPNLQNRSHIVGLVRQPIFYNQARKIQENTNHKKQIKESLGYGNKKLILLTGGGIFIAKSSPYLKNIARNLQTDSSLAAVVLCGSDEKFMREARANYSSISNLEFKGWLTSEEMADYMTASDFTFSFSAAQTPIEATLLGSPCLVFDFIKGQETCYVELLTKNKAALELTGSHSERLEQAFSIVRSEKNEFDLTNWQKKLIVVPETLKQALDDIKLQAS